MYVYVCEGRFVKVEIPPSGPGKGLVMFDEENRVGFECAEPGKYVSIEPEKVMARILEGKQRPKFVAKQKEKHVVDFTGKYQEMAEKIQELPNMFTGTIWQE